MSKKITWEKIEIKGKYAFSNWRIYKRSLPIKNWKNISGKIVDLKNDYENFHRKYKEDLVEQQEQNFDTVIVSDAKDHFERLCFLADTLKDKDGNIFYNIAYQCIGKNTGMYYSFAGDEKAIKKDEVYLRFIDFINR